VNVYAPISGVIVAQNVTNAVAAGVTYSGSSTAFTIADLSVVWIVCDVYGNDLPQMHLGQEAQIHFDSYPGQALTGKISDIGPVPDPSIRTAKVRIEVANPGMLRMGMFATATLIGRTRGVHATVPADTILHLHDQDWVSIAAGQGHLLPAAMSRGIGSDSQRPFAIVIVGGLIADLIMSIFLLPTLYVWIARDTDILPPPEMEFEN
jgi:cobalt-zinc-cadmium efflux system membrane fusion protein